MMYAVVYLLILAYVSVLDCCGEYSKAIPNADGLAFACQALIAGCL